MTKILIIYATEDGQTAKIAERMAETARSRGIEVDVKDTSQPLATEFSFEDYKGIMVGSPLHHRRYADSIVQFVSQNKSELDCRPSAFFSVSLADATRWSSGADWLLKLFYKETGWHPKMVGRFGGALKYTRYDFWTRFFMWLAGIFMRYPTDTSRDHDLTDWDQVTEFANTFVTTVEGQSLVADI